MSAKRHTEVVEVLGPWSVATSKAFWEGFAPAPLAAGPEQQRLRTAFCVEADWRRAEVAVTQHGVTATVVGHGVHFLTAYVASV